MLSGIGQGGVGVLRVDCKEVARPKIEHTIPLVTQWDENFDIGADTGTPVSNDYQVPFKFIGKLTKLTLNINRPKLTPEDIQKLKGGGTEQPGERVALSVNVPGARRRASASPATRKRPVGVPPAC